jgi:hypothetical protein
MLRHSLNARIASAGQRACLRACLSGGWTRRGHGECRRGNER